MAVQGRPRSLIFVPIGNAYATFVKVNIRPDFTRTVPNFDGLSRENYEVSRDAELSRIPNPVPILPRFECNVTSHVDNVYSYLYPIIITPNSLSSAQNAPNPFRPCSAPDPAEVLTTLPQTP